MVHQNIDKIHILKIKAFETNIRMDGFYDIILHWTAQIEEAFTAWGR